MATTTSDLAVQNWFETTLSSSISSSDTTIPLNALPTGAQGFLVIEPDNENSREIIFFTSKTGAAVVCSSAADGRGQDGTAAVSHASGSTVRMQIVGAYWQAIQDGTGLNSGALSGTPFATGWVTSALPAVSSVTCNGNRSYDVTFASTVAATLTPGIKLRLSRTVAAPTQCTDLEASSSQYYSKSSPAGMTFTDDFTCGAWVKMESYHDGAVITRYDGSTGWLFRILSTGQVKIQGIGTAGAVDEATSYQSIPLNRWVHVAATLDMSGATSTIYIDGVSVPVSYTNGAASAVIQAGNLQVGAYNGATAPFDGKLAQVFVASTVLSAANIRLLISQGLTASLISTHSIISAYSFDNSINDLNTTNANNLTANGSAVATNADSPFALDANGTPGGTYEWGIVTKVATTTATVQVPEGSAIPTSGGVSAVALSAHKVPYGFPSQGEKWRLESLFIADLSKASPVSGTYYNQNMQLTVPLGSWVEGYEGTMFINNSGANPPNGYSTLSSSTSASTDDRFTIHYAVSTNTINISQYGGRRNPQQETVQTTRYLLVKVGTPTSAAVGYRNSIDESYAVIYAECAHL